MSETRSVPRGTRRARRLARDVLETMHAASGVELAAPQVGARQRVIVVDVGENPIALVNPEITAADGEPVGLEGCLSLPDLVGEAGKIADLVEGKAKVAQPRLWRLWTRAVLRYGPWIVAGSGSLAGLLHVWLLRPCVKEGDNSGIR